MSGFARLVSDLAWRLGAERLVVLGCRRPQRLAELSGELPVIVLDTATELAALDDVGAQLERVEWSPEDGAAPPVAADTLAGALVVCDRLLDDVRSPAPLLAALSSLLEVAPGGVLSVRERELAGGSLDGGFAAGELEELLAGAGIAVEWLGITDAAGPLGARCGLTAALAGTRPGEVGEELAAGPLGVGFDRALAGAAEPSEGEAPLRVGIVSYEFVGPTRTGGIGTAYTSLADALAAAGHEVTVLFTGWEEPGTAPLAHWVGHYERRGIELVALPPHAAEDIDAGHQHAARAYEALGWLRERHRQRPFDVVHFPEVLGHGRYIAAAKRQGLGFEGATIVAGAHSSTSWVLETNALLCQNLNDFADDFIERESVAGADSLVSPSAYMVEWMQSQGWRLPARTFVQQYVRSGAVDGRTKPSGDAPPTATGATEVVFFGRLETRKGLRVFCDALDRLAAEDKSRRLTVTFLGKQSTVDGMQAADYIEHRADAWPWATQVIDDRAQPEAIAYLTAPGRRLTVIPSLADNSPNTVYEALALEIPFIASRRGGTGELIDPRDLARSTFDPLAGGDAAALARGDLSAGADELAQKLRAAIGAERLAPPRPSVDADLNRREHLDWHRALRRKAEPAPAAEEGPEAEVWIVGGGADTTAASRASAEAQRPAPAVIRDAPSPAAAAPAGNAAAVAFVRAGARLEPGALECLTRALEATGADAVSCAVRIERFEKPPSIRVPTGGPAVAGLVRRCFGDLVFVVRGRTFARVGGFDAGTAPDDQAHELLCRLAISGARIEVVPEVLAAIPADVAGSPNLAEAWRRRPTIVELYRRAPDEIRDQLPLLLQQSWAMEGEYERAFIDLYRRRYGRLTVPLRWTAHRVRRLQARVRPARKT